MSLKIALQMDPIEAIDIRGDSSFALALEAQRRGYNLFTYHPDSLALQPGKTLSAQGSWIKVKDAAGNHVKILHEERLDLTDMDVILMRQDPPFDMHYITATHLLETIAEKTLIINNPAAVRNAPEKLVATLFPELMPPTLITGDLDSIRAFREAHKDIIIKPLHGNGGAGVFYLKADDSNFASLIEMMQHFDPVPLMAQKYLPAVRQGDKRVILIDGVAKGAVNRLPPKGEARANFHVGGTAQKAALDADDLRIAETIGPYLKTHGLLFAGIDVIGGFLTEINTTSPTGLREIEALSGINLAAEIWDSITAKLT